MSNDEDKRFDYARYNGLTTYWRFNDDLENPAFDLEWQKLWNEMYQKMAEAEDSVARDAVINYLRDRGYTVIEPEGFE